MKGIKALTNRIVGSNPTLSAIPHVVISGSYPLRYPQKSCQVSVKWAIGVLLAFLLFACAGNGPDYPEYDVVVAYGTSLTEHGAWVQQTADRCGLNIINSGMAGQDSYTGVIYLYERVIKLNPDAVLIEFSINDAFHKLTLDESRTNLETMVDAILKHNPACDIFVMTMNTTWYWWHHPDRSPHLSDFYHVYRNVAQDRGLYLIDIYPVWMEVMSDNPVQRFNMYYDASCIHPNEEGCLEIVTPAVASVLCP